MSQVPSTSTSTTNFETIFTSALKEYKKQTKRDISSHPLAAQLQSCDTPSAILAVLQTRVQKFDQSQSDDERWIKWVDPTVNVLFAFSATLGNSVGLVFPPANAIFTGIGVLLQAIKDVRASQNALVNLFGRLEYFFQRLEKYIDVRPTEAMKNIIVKIMAEVLSILGIVTKEVGQGRTKAYLKKLIGRKDVEEALQRLDQLTQEECRMAAAENLVITRGIDNKVKDVGDKVKDISDKVRDVDDRVRDVDNKVTCVDEKVEDLDEKMQGVNIKVEAIGHNMRTVDSKVHGVDHKVGSIIQGVKETGVMLEQVVNQVTDLNRNELRKDLRKWIAPPDPSVNYNAASSAHHDGTAGWCTKGNTLAVWKATGSLLWIHGKPGSGKSILSSVIIRDLKPLSNARSAFLAYFYFDFKDTAKQDSRALLSSLLVQLSDQSDIFCDTLFSLYSAHNRGSEQPTVDSLIQCLKEMLTVMGQVPIYLVIDALDECPDDSGIPSLREMVLELVKEIVELGRPNLHLCITSRPEFDIRTTLEPLATQKVSLHDESGQKQDINDYITFVVHTDRRMKRWRDEDKDTVTGDLTAKANGMFRWVFCQLEVLRHGFPTNLRRILDELPESLDETYERILKKINNSNREHAYRLLQCLTVAIRPLRVEELADVLAVDFHAGGMPKLDASWRWEDQEEAVLTACSSLVTLIIDKGSRVLQFSHFSVKEFLTSDRLVNSVEEVSQFHIPIEPSHVILAQACLSVLLRLDDRTGAEDIPLVRYAGSYWYQHAQIGNVELHIKDAMDHFFDMDKPHFSAWIRIQRPFSLLRYSPSEKTFPSAPLYLAAYYGLRGLVGRIVTKHPQHVNSWGGRAGTPLHASVFGGHLEVAQLLFVHGADINSRSEDHQTPLHIASERGHSDVGEWLLNCGADVNSRGVDGRTPLHHVAGNTQAHLEAARVLLERSPEVNARDNDGFTPFLRASESGNPDVLRLLLDHNADEHVRNNSGNTALHCAARDGHLEVARILLGRGAEVDARNHLEITIRCASTDGRASPLSPLLLDEHLRDRGMTPLHYAATNGHPEVVRLLLEQNAEVNSQDNRGFTPFLFASRMGNIDIFRLLLDHNGNEHVHDNEGKTPLHYAAYFDYLDAARLLLERNVDINARDTNGLTPFLCASASWNSSVLKLLLDHDVDEHVRDDVGSTPLHYAAANNSPECAQLLLKRGAEVNARNDFGFTALAFASKNGHPEVARLLLNQNTDVNVRDSSENTPLHLSAARGHIGVSRLLLEHGADDNAQNNEGSTPLHRASNVSSEGGPHVVRLLLDHGADEQVRDFNGKTAFEVARDAERQEIVQLFSKQAAE